MRHKPPFLPPALGLLVMLGIFALHFILPLGTLFPYPWNFIGLLPVVIGALLNIAADRELQRAGTTIQPFERPTTLVDRGVYRLSRNPMYLGSVCIAVGLAIWVGSLSSWVVLPIFVLVLHWAFIRYEERVLEQDYGASYQAYCQRVCRWYGRRGARQEADR